MKSGIIWMLHRVAPKQSENYFKLDKSIRISPEFLEQQIIKAKEKGYKFISLDTFLANKHQAVDGSKNIVVTIDDGFRDIYLYAFPIFKKHQVPFTFYVSSDLIKYGCDKCNLPEMDGIIIISDIISARQSLNIMGNRILCKTQKQKDKAFGLIWKNFSEQKKKTNSSGREILCSILKEENINFDYYFHEYVCQPEELREMAQSDLCTIGSHGKSHQALPIIQSEKFLEAEFLESLSAIEAWIGKKIYHFSYPYGQYNELVKSYAQKYYTSAVTIAPPRNFKQI